MKYFILLLSSCCVLCEWTRLSELFESSTQFYVRDIFIEEAAGIIHLIWHYDYSKTLHYWKLYGNHKKIIKKEIHAEENAGFFSAKLKASNNGKSLHIILMGIRSKDNKRFFDQWYTESKDGGETWSDPIRAPRENMEDLCERYGTALTVIPETGHIMWAFHVVCASDPPQLHICIRQPSEEKFDKEKSIYKSEEYDEVKPSIQIEYTLKEGKPIVHFIWANFNQTSRPIMHMSSSDFGQTFSKAKVISSAGDYYSGFYSIITTSSPKISSALVGTYSVSPPKQLRLFYSFDHGESFRVIEATDSDQEFFTWKFALSGLEIGGTSAKPTLFMLSQISIEQIEYNHIDLNTMEISRGIDHPFVEQEKAFGVTLFSKLIDSKIELTAIVPGFVREDGGYLMYLARDIRDI